MKTFRKVLKFMSSLAIMMVSVLILLLVSLASMIFNAVLFILMISALLIPVLGNMLLNRANEKSTLSKRTSHT